MHIQTHLFDNLILINMQFKTTQSKQKCTRTRIQWGSALPCQREGRYCLWDQGDKFKLYDVLKLPPRQCQLEQTRRVNRGWSDRAKYRGLAAQGAVLSSLSLLHHGRRTCWRVQTWQVKTISPNLHLFFFLVLLVDLARCVLHRG